MDTKLNCCCGQGRTCPSHGDSSPEEREREDSIPKSKIIRARVLIETEIVVENYYGEDDQKCAESAVRGNIGDIISQAFQSGEVKVDNVAVVTDKAQLPPRWSLKSLPWLPSITFGSNKQETRISEFLE